MVFWIPLSESVMKEVGQTLNEACDSYDLLYQGNPHVNLAYREDNHVDALSLWSKLSEYKLIETNQNRIMNMTYLSFNEVQEIKPAFFLISMGASPRVRNLNVAMNDIDEFAKGVIINGLELGLEPSWIRTSYPFLENNGIMEHQGFDSYALKEIVGRIRGAPILSLR